MISTCCICSWTRRSRGSLPGEKFEYSNSGYTLLGLIVEVAAQKPFHEFMASEIFRPLGMNDSVLYQRGLNEIPHRAFGHERSDGKWVRADQSLTSAVRGDGGVYSSLRDYRKWLRGIDEQKLLSKASYDAMFSPQVVTDRNGSHYGYGWFLDEYRGEPRIHHNGDTHGFRLCVQRFPKRDAAILIQLNCEVEGDADDQDRRARGRHPHFQPLTNRTPRFHGIFVEARPGAAAIGKSGGDLPGPDEAGQQIPVRIHVPAQHHAEHNQATVYDLNLPFDGRHNYTPCWTGSPAANHACVPPSTLTTFS